MPPHSGRNTIQMQLGNRSRVPANLRVPGNHMAENIERSRTLYARACAILPGGVNSPVRAFRAVHGTPLFIAGGKGPLIFDVDGNEYVDFVGSWGAAILGHAHPEVVAMVAHAASEGLSFGAPTEKETQLAEAIRTFFPTLEMLRMVNSGTEATMSAIRLARGYTGRSRIIKFAGCYHGHADALLAGAGSGVVTFGLPGSPGVPEATVSDTFVLPYNDTFTLRETFARYGEEVAAVIVEPIAGNMGFVRAHPEFLRTMRRLCSKAGSVLIYDEVMSGFRVAAGGVQSLLGILPDLTTLGKVVGGGLPFGVFGGRSELMRELAPCGPVYQAGTLSGNPLVTAVALKTLLLLGQAGFYERLAKRTRQLCDGLSAAAANYHIAFHCDSEGGMFGCFFSAQKVSDFAAVKMTDTGLFARYHGGMLRRGIYLAPSAFEAGFVSSAHDEVHIQKTVAAAHATFQEINKAAPPEN